MFCPKCGQSQASDAMRFCPRCGFALVGVAELLATGGVLPTTPNAYAGVAGGAPVLSPRRRGVRQGAKLLLVGAFLVPLLVFMHEMIRTPAEFAFLGVLTAIAGIMRLIYALLFEDKTPAAHAAPPAAQGQLGPRTPSAALQSGGFHPAQTLFPRRADTAEIQTPASVTDHTTRLLGEREDPAGS